MDPNFTPGSDEYELQLFEEQKDFLYSVLISSLKTEFSDTLVKDHEGDAQLILDLLHDHHTGNSQYSRAEINRITKYLTSIKLDDTWIGTNKSFLMHCNDQLRLLDSLVDSDEKLPDNAIVTFLESAVESVPDLQHVKITENVLQAQLDSTRPISYRSYFDLLKDAAFHLDQATKRGNKIRHTNVHFSGTNDEDEHHILSSDDNQVIQQENVCSEPPEPLSYSLFQSHFQGSSTSNTQKIFFPKPIWEKLSKDQQQMIIEHNRSLPKSGSPHLSTPNKSPSPLPHKPTPQQTAKSQQVHTHQSDESTTDTIKTETTPSDPLLAIVHRSINTSDDDASDISNVLSVRGLIRFKSVNATFFSLNLITNTKIRLKIALDLPSVTPTLSRTPLVALLAVGYSVCSTSVLYSTTWHLQLFKAYALFKLWKELLQTLVSCFISHFMSLSTTGLILLSLISTFLHQLMKRRVIGSVLPTTKVTVSPGGSSLRILKRSSFVLAFEVPSELQQTSVLHHLQGRGPHFLFPFLILNNLQILCHLIPLMNQHPILSNLSTVSLVKMKTIQSTWPTLTFPIFLADPFFYHLRIMGSATWPKSLTLMTMDNLLKPLNSS